MKTVLRNSVIYLIIICVCYNQTSLGQISGIQFSDGVILDKAGAKIFIMTPDRKSASVSAKTGEITWESKDTMKPIGFINGKLIGQSEDSLVSNKFIFATIDFNSKDTTIFKDSVKLSQNNLVPSMYSRIKFSTYQTSKKKNLYISWEYENEYPKQGFFNKDSIFGIHKSKSSGLVKIQGKTGKHSFRNSNKTSNSVDRPLIADGTDRISGINSVQFLSVDQNNILVSEKVASDTAFNNYVWNIYNRKGEGIGRIFDYRSYAPFYVTGDTIIYEIGPYSIRKDGMIIDVPLQIKAASLKNDQSIWAQNIFDGLYRKSAPPKVKSHTK